MLIAVTLTLAGFAIEAGLGHRELGAVFAVFFAIGCVAAVLAVRRSGLFAAVIQPPLLLFVAIPLAYYLFQGGKFNGLKDGLITCGYPLIERFPLMLITSAIVLAIGLFRWYAGKGQAAGDPHVNAEGLRAPGSGAKVRDRQTAQSSLVSRITAMFSGGSGDRNESSDRRAPRHGGRPARTKRPASRTQDRPGRHEQATSGRSRHSRPVREEFVDAPPRNRRGPAERPPREVRDFEAAAPPRRRPRPTPETGSRHAAPPPPRREPRQRPPEYAPRDGRRDGPRPSPREGRERRDPRPTRGYEPRGYEQGRHEERGFEQPYPARPDYPPYPPRRRPEADPRGGGVPRNGVDDHHPVSRVRYRSDDRDQDRR